MWQKERLLNLALAHLPEACQKVAWIDCDILFENPDWAVDAVNLLEDYPVVQLFEKVVHVPRGRESCQGGEESWSSFAAVHERLPDMMLKGNFAEHGHTGFAWAARKEVLRQGLYDACIAGGADHLMAHAMCGTWSTPCIDRIIGHNERHHEHFMAWGERMYADVRAEIGAVPGNSLHLWHGEMADRRYLERYQELQRFGFDPHADLRVGPEGCWEWNSDKPDMHQWVKNYFGQRKEDG